MRGADCTWLSMNRAATHENGAPSISQAGTRIAARIDGSRAPGRPQAV